MSIIITLSKTIAHLNEVLCTKLFVSFKLLFFISITFSSLYSQIEKTNFAQSDSNNLFYQNHHINIYGIFFSGAIGDLVYAGLYKTPVMGGSRFSYHYQTPVMRHGFLIEAGAGRIFSPYLNGPAELYPNYPPVNDLSVQGNIYYSSTFSVLHITSPHNMSIDNDHSSTKGVFDYTLSLGPGAHFYLNGWIPDTIDVLRYTWVAHTGVGIEIYQNLRFDETHEFGIIFYLPILGAGWRPTYNMYTLREESLLETKGFLAAFFANPNFLAWHNFVSVTLELRYQYHFNTLLSLIFSYQGRLEFISVPRIRLDLQNNLAVGIGFNF